MNSVHLSDFPDFNSIYSDDVLIKQMDVIRDICTTALNIRHNESLRVRLPLKELKFVKLDANSLEEYSDIIKDEINVKNVVFDSDIENYADFRLTINFPVLGKRLPTKMKDIIAASKQNNWKKLENGNIEIIGEELLQNEFTLALVPKNTKGTQALNSNDSLVILDTEITEDLQQEGIARDVIRVIQQSRKEADLDISDYIDLTIQTNNEKIINSISKFEDYLKSQTLTKNLNFNVNANSNISFTHKIEDDEIKLFIN